LLEMNEKTTAAANPLSRRNFLGTFENPFFP